MVEKLKKIILGIVGGIMIYRGGIGSCHYTCSHYYYSKKEYDKCLYHAQQAGRYFSPYIANAYRYRLEFTLEHISKKYDECEDYYRYYLTQESKIPSKTMHLEDTYLENQIRFVDAYIGDKSSECLFFRMHRNSRHVYLKDQYFE